MPGWGVVADLTPPELIEARRLAVLRRLIAAGLALVLLLCVGGYVLAERRNSAAQAAADSASQQSTQLIVDGNRYTDVTALENATQSLRTQVGTLLIDDVDVAALVKALYAKLPPTVGLNTVNVSLTPAAAAATPSLTAASIGTVTLSGASRQLSDLASYVLALEGIRGVMEVIPSSNSAVGSASAATWTITLQLNDKLYTHRYDVAPTVITPTATAATPSTGASPTGGN